MTKRWEPVPMGVIVLVDPDDSQLGDSIVVDGVGCFMRVNEDHRQAEVWLPDDLRLCRLVDDDQSPPCDKRAGGHTEETERVLL